VIISQSLRGFDDDLTDVTSVTPPELYRFAMQYLSVARERSGGELCPAEIDAGE
jgi:hypothetical protein